jgi:hypothetical protein
VPTLEIINTLATLATAMIAFSALKSWKHQDKARKESDFIDALVDSMHTYIVEMHRPMTLLLMTETGMEGYRKTWQESEPAEIIFDGARDYVYKNGGQDAKKFAQILELAQPSVVKLRSLIAKGQVFKFPNYASCQKDVAMLTWHFDRLEAFAAFIGNSSWNWDHPEVREQFSEIIKIDSENMNQDIQRINVSVLEFAGTIYARIYGQS